MVFDFQGRWRRSPRHTAGFVAGPALGAARTPAYLSNDKARNADFNTRPKAAGGGPHQRALTKAAPFVACCPRPSAWSELQWADATQGCSHSKESHSAHCLSDAQLCQHANLPPHHWDEPGQSTQHQQLHGRLRGESPPGMPCRGAGL